MKEPLKGIESSVCMDDSWMSFFLSFRGCMAQLSSACPACSQLMDTLEETAVGDIMLYTILLKVDLRYTEGICLVLSAWRMSAADSQPSEAQSNV